ncbi:MAG: hypothetical protein FWG44_04370 [Oscillospiraceae bacterium]|nr:hypothetical protein [Oscillospiraceae bacterium]
MKRKIIAFSLALAIVVSSMLALPASAHEYAPGRAYRWHERGVAGSYITQAFVRINGSGMANGFQNHYSSSLTEWNNNSGSKAFFSDRAKASADCLIESPSTSGWVLLPGGYDAYTFIYNGYMSGLCENPINPLSKPGGFNSGTIRSAIIHFNPSMTAYATPEEMQYYIRHEMGHVLGLRHPDSSVSASVMFNMTKNYRTVQAHDRSDLASFY